MAGSETARESEEVNDLYTGSPPTVLFFPILAIRLLSTESTGLGVK